MGDQTRGDAPDDGARAAFRGAGAARRPAAETALEPLRADPSYDAILSELERRLVPEATP